MTRQRFVEERVVRVEQIKHRSIALEEVREEANRLFIHRPAQVGKGGEVPLALFIEDIEVMDVQPLTGKLDGEPPRPRVAQHAPSLSDEVVLTAPANANGNRERRGGDTARYLVAQAQLSGPRRL